MASYANSFRIVMGDMETQIVFRLTTPVINEEKGKVEGVSTEDIIDMRVSPQIAEDLYRSLGEQLGKHKKTHEE